MSSFLKVFAYGSNMCSGRILARAASAVPVMIGHVTHRRLAFHKRGVDGSAKADAVHTGRDSDSVWGVVFSIPLQQVAALNEYERGYDAQKVVVVGTHGAIAASMYVARAEVIDRSLQPYSWYHHFVVRGAMEHRLPAEYVQSLQAIEAIADPDRQRCRHNRQLIESAIPRFAAKVSSAPNRSTRRHS